jgi:hypothetical protein
MISEPSSHLRTSTQRLPPPRAPLINLAAIFCTKLDAQSSDFSDSWLIRKLTTGSRALNGIERKKNRTDVVRLRERRETGAAERRRRATMRAQVTAVGGEEETRT